MLKNFTRGGQVAVHSLRMFNQVLKITLSGSLIVFLLAASWSVYSKTTPYQRSLYVHYWGIQLRHMIQLAHQDEKKYSYPLPNGKSISYKPSQVLKRPFFKQNIHWVNQKIAEAPFMGLLGSLLSFLLLGMFFGWRGYHRKKDRLLRGNRLADKTETALIIKQQKKASDLNLDGLPLIQDMETAHVLVTGTTGSGKSNCFRTLMPQMRKREDRAIVVDTTGDMVQKFYNPETDIILNPLDQRSVSWNIFRECETLSELDTFAQSIIPNASQNGDTFWDDAARTVFASAVRKLKEEGRERVDDLSEILIKSSLAEYHEFFRETDAASLTDKAGDRTTLSIRSNLASKVMWLKYLHDQGTPFCMRQWINEEKPNQWLFITAQKKDLKSLRPIVSAWFDLAINSLLNLPVNEKRRLWFILDELASLQKLPSLETGLAEGRKFGGCFLVGTQSTPQLNALYGHHSAHALLDLFNTRVFFRSNDNDTTQWISKTLGDAEIEESNESLSYGANTIRDGVSLNNAKKMKPIAIPSEISSLENLECFIKLPEGYPITRMKMSYKSISDRAIPFEERNEFNSFRFMARNDDSSQSSEYQTNSSDEMEAFVQGK